MSLPVPDENRYEPLEAWWDQWDGINVYVETNGAAWLYADPSAIVVDPDADPDAADDAEVDL